MIFHICYIKFDHLSHGFLRAVGINCHFDPFVTLEGLRLMKKAMDEAGIKKHMIAQPLAFHTPDAKRQGFIDLPEFPFGEH